MVELRFSIVAIADNHYQLNDDNKVAKVVKAPAARKEEVVYPTQLPEGAVAPVCEIL